MAQWDLEARLTATEAALLLPTVTPQDVYNWARRGKLTPDTQRRYRLGDILQAERNTRSRVRTRGGRQRAA